MNPSPSLLRQFVRNFIPLVLLALLGGLTGCDKKGGSGQGAGVTGDYVTGTPLPERREGSSFYGGNVQRGQYQPIYFDFDSQTIRASETEKIRQIASAMQCNSSANSNAICKEPNCLSVSFRVAAS